MAASKAPIVLRLAIYSIGINSSKSASDRLYWLLNHVDIFTLWLRHEVYIFVAGCYSDADTDAREALVKTILAKRESDFEDEPVEYRTDRLHFDWLSWLVQIKPDCSIAESALFPIRAKYPEWRLSEHPDFLIYHSGAYWGGLSSPFSVEQLLSMNPADHINEWENYTGNVIDGPDREGLLSEMVEACKHNTQWSLSLADALAQKRAWESDIWTSIIHAWREVELTMNDLKMIILQLTSLDLQKAHANHVANLLYSLVKVVRIPIDDNILKELNNIADSVWELIAEEEDVDSRWLQKAINNSAGIITLFWLNSLSYLLKKKNLKDGVLPDYYQKQFNKILDEPSLKGAYGRCILLSQATFLFAIDEVWTRIHLLPIFMQTDEQHFKQAWDGYLTWGRLDASIATDLIPAFLLACTKLDWLHKDIRVRFVQLLVALTIFHIEDPFCKLLPTFYENSSIDDRMNFLNTIGSYLREMETNAMERLWNNWLHRYLEMRLISAYGVLIKEEIAAIMDWLAHLDYLYPEAVNLIIRFPLVQLDHGTLLFRMGESDLVERYPIETANLLIYLGKCVQNYYDKSCLSDISKRLHSLPPDIKHDLNEELVRIGLPQVT